MPQDIFDGEFAVVFDEHVVLNPHTRKVLVSREITLEHPIYSSTGPEVAFNVFIPVPQEPIQVLLEGVWVIPYSAHFSDFNSIKNGSGVSISILDGPNAGQVFNVTVTSSDNIELDSQFYSPASFVETINIVSAGLLNAAIVDNSIHVKAADGVSSINAVDLNQSGMVDDIIYGLISINSLIDVELW